MYLTKVDIQNFRVFYGAHTVDFASRKGKALTIFHGETGAGKTTLLNAIHWCLTGKLTPGVKNKEIVNHDAVLEDEFDYFVELSFEHEGKDYRFKRGLENGGLVCKLIILEEDGNHKPYTGDGERFIQKIIPRDLIKWFFFDGEAIDKFSLGSSDFKKNLRETLGFLYVDKLKSDLSKALSKKQRQVSALINDSEIKKLQEAKDRVEIVMPPQEERRNTLLTEEKQNEIQQDEVDRHLSNMPKVSELQKRRSSLEREIKFLQSEKDATQKIIIHLLASSSAPIFLREDAEKLEKIFEIKEVEGKLPAPYSNQLVDDILRSNVCICGRTVESGSKEEIEINKLLEFANTSELNFRLTQARYLIQDIKTVSSSFLSKLEKLREKVSSIDSKIALALSDIDEVGSSIRQTDIAETNRLEDLRTRLRSENKKIHAERVVVENSIQQNKRTLIDLGIKIDTLSKKIGGNKKLLKEIDKINKVLLFTEKQSVHQEEQVLRILNSELNASLKQFLTKNYVTRIDPDSYKVILIDEDGRLVAESTGEGQILKFAFISTLIAIAAKRTKEQIEFLVEPTVAPLVLDAPFSTLDEHSGSSVAKAVADNVDQLVLMGNEKAWDISVESSLKPFIGKQYLIVQRAKGPRNDRVIKKITLNGKEYELNEYESERNDSYIKEVVLK